MHLCIYSSANGLISYIYVQHTFFFFIWEINILVILFSPLFKFMHHSFSQNVFQIISQIPFIMSIISLLATILVNI